MDIHDLHHRYDISVKKLNRMKKDGHLRVGRSSAPLFLQKVRDEIRKGTMSALSIAIAYKFLNRVEQFMEITPANRRVIKEHFKKAELKSGEIFPEANESWEVQIIPFMAAENDDYNMREFIRLIQEIIPNRHVDYYYVAVRYFLRASKVEDLDFPVTYMTRGLAAIRENPAMRGWWHRGEAKYGKRPIVFHMPDSQYDL